MNVTQYVDSKYYEVFEIHSLPRGLTALTLRINKKGATQYITKQGTVRIPMDSLTIHIGIGEELPKDANFLIPNHLGFNKVRYSTTKSFPKIHNRIDAIKDALNHTNLHIFINGQYHNPYKLGQRYPNKGLYHGVVEEHIDGKTNTYHYFTDGKEITKEYFEQPKKESA